MLRLDPLIVHHGFLHSFRRVSVHVLSSIYVCVFCTLLLEATRTVFLQRLTFGQTGGRRGFPVPGAFTLPHLREPLPQHRQPATSSGSRLLGAVVPPVFASPLPNVVNGEKYYGVMNCIMATHTDVTRCNNSYHQALSNIIVRGNFKISGKYRKQFCCGFWARERCLIESIQRRCDSATFEIMQRHKSPYANQVDTRQSPEMDCVGFERDSQICAASPLLRHHCGYRIMLLLMIGTVLIYYYCFCFGFFV